MSAHVDGPDGGHDNFAYDSDISDEQAANEAAMEAEIRFNTLAVRDFSILLGVKKTHQQNNLNDYLASIRKNGAGDIVKDVWKGVDKLRFGCLSEFALRHFKEAAARERPTKNEVFLRFKLFAEIMVICFTEDLNGNGSCFRSFEHLEKKDKIAIGADIGITIRIMEVEEMPTDEMKHLIYNLWSKCCNYVNSNKVIIGKDPIKVMIDTGKIPKN